MSLRARVLIGMAVVAIVLGVTAIVVTRTTEQHLVDQVDEQLRTAGRPEVVSPGQPGGPGGGAPRLSAFYVGILRQDGSLDEIASPDVQGDDAAAVPEP